MFSIDSVLSLYVFIDSCKSLWMEPGNDCIATNETKYTRDIVE